MADVLLFVEFSGFGGFFLYFVGFVGGFIFLDTIVIPFLSSSVPSVALCFIAKYEAFCFLVFAIAGVVLSVSFGVTSGWGCSAASIDWAALCVATVPNNHSGASFSLCSQVYNPVQFSQVSICVSGVVV